MSDPNFVLLYVADPARQRDRAAKGSTIAQTPTAMDFVFTFAAVGSDGHRLQVLASGASV